MEAVQAKLEEVAIKKTDTPSTEKTDDAKTNTADPITAAPDVATNTKKLMVQKRMLLTILVKKEKFNLLSRRTRNH